MAELTHTPAEKRREKGHYSPLTYVLAYVTFCLLMIANWALGKVDLGMGRVPVAFGIGGVVAVGMMVVFMHLALHHPAARVAMGVSLFFVLLLATIALLDVLTRFPGVQPKSVPDSELVPHRPRPTRTTPEDFGPPPPHRLPGH